MTGILIALLAGTALFVGLALFVTAITWKVSDDTILVVMTIVFLLGLFSYAGASIIEQNLHWYDFDWIN